MGRSATISVCLLLACAVPEAPQAVGPAPEIQLLGQRTLGAEHRFDTETPMRVWVGAPGAWALRLDGRELAAEHTARDGSVWLTATAANGRLSVHAPGGAEVAAWTVRAAPAPSAHHPEVVRLRNAGELDAALARLTARLRGAEGESLLWGQVELGRLQHRKGALDAAVDAWSEAADTADRMGLPSEAAARWRAIAFVHYWRGELDRAPAWLNRAADRCTTTGDVTGSLRVDYLRGLLAADLGELRRARLLLSDTSRRARTLGLDREARDAGLMLGWVLTTVGRHREAARLFAGELADLHPKGDARRAAYLANHAWALLNAAARGRTSDVGAAERMLDEAHALYAARGDKPRADNVATNRAWAALLRGDPAEAARRAAEVHERRGIVRLFIPLLEADLAAAAGRRDEARRTYESVLALARSEGAREYIWRALLGRARTQTDPDAALADYSAGLDAVEHAARDLGVRTGAAPFFADRRALVDEAVALLVARGDIERAFEISERGRAQVLRTLERRVAGERLPESKRARWRQHVARFTRARTALERFDADGAMVWREGERTSRARERVRLRTLQARAFDAAYAWLAETMPSRPPARAAAVQAALGASETLLAFSPAGVFTVTGDSVRLTAQAPVVGRGPIYAIGAPDDAALPPQTRHLPDASFLLRDAPAATAPSVVVGDPTRDLPEARAEARAVAATGDLLLLGDAATREAMLGRLRGARRLHFAGHGVLHPEDPWEAHLRLARGERLTLEDVLVARPQVGVVVLSGCRTGAATPLEGGERVGLPEAFLAAGAQAVLVTRRDVGDAEARRFVERFYAADGPPAQAFAAAVQQSIAANDDAWQAFRLWGRG